MAGFAEVLTLASAAGGIAQGIGGAREASLAARVAEQNAALSRQQAAAEAARLQRRTGRAAGAARSAIGASGITFEGTPTDILADQALEAEEQRLLTLFGGETRAAEFEFEADVARQRRTGALIGIGGSVGESLLSGATFAAQSGRSSFFGVPLGSQAAPGANRVTTIGGGRGPAPGIVAGLRGQGI